MKGWFSEYKILSFLLSDGPSFVSPILTGQKTMKITDVGQSITCAVTGNPLPTVTWFRDGRPIERDSDRFSVSVTEEALDQHQRKVSSLLRWTGESDWSRQHLIPQ